MAQPGFAQEYSSAAFILILIAGILIILDGIYTAAAIALIGSAILGLFPGLTALLIGVAVVALILGLLILYGAFRIRNHPESTKTWGILVLVFSLISIIGGGGFVIGLILGLVGGILAIVWKPSVVQTYGQPMMGQPMGQPMGASGWAAQPPPTPGMPPVAGGGAQFCQFCGTAIPAGAKFCPKCGAGVPGA